MTDWLQAQPYVGNHGCYEVMLTYGCALPNLNYFICCNVIIAIGQHSVNAKYSSHLKGNELVCSGAKLKRPGPGNRFESHQNDMFQYGNNFINFYSNRMKKVINQGFFPKYIGRRVMFTVDYSKARQCLL